MKKFFFLLLVLCGFANVSHANNDFNYDLIKSTGLPTLCSDAVLKSAYGVVFYDEEGIIVGKLRWGNGQLQFNGEADRAAHVFFETFLKKEVDAYLRGKK